MRAAITGFAHFTWSLGFAAALQSQAASIALRAAASAAALATVSQAARAVVGKAARHQTAKTTRRGHGRSWGPPRTTSAGDNPLPDRGSR
jgi:hypothetical protein